MDTQWRREYMCLARGWFGARMKNRKKLKEKGNIINVIPSHSQKVVSARLLQQYCSGV